mmetsp:Transcript_28313/g.34997  ORF Transcript_28313/g.34997 Transcript_28313/m.34997 type:complete len:348 (+) Transcript_28313:307-1350(+)
MSTPTEIELFRLRLSRGFYSWNIQNIMRTVKQHPNLLQTAGGMLALQKACDMDPDSVSIELIMVLIEEGIKLNFGERGGLRLSFKTGTCPLQLLIKRGSLQVLKGLAEANPPFLSREDVSKHSLLHLAAGYGHLDVVQFLITLDPQAVSSRNKHGALPIHMTCSSIRESHDELSRFRSVREILIETFLTRVYFKSTHDQSRIDPQDAITVFEWFFPTPNSRSSKDARKDYVQDIVSILNQFDLEIPILPAAIKVDAPQYHIQQIIDLIRECAEVRDESNRLSLHLAAEQGIKWSEGLKDVLDAFVPAIYEADVVTGLPQFALAAAGGDSDLDGVYELMKRFPDPIYH